MSESICKFMPAKNQTVGIKTVHFVYESDFHTLKQPFLRPIYYAHLVTKGQARMQVQGKEYALEVGTLFFFIPAVPVTITASEDFKYLYISFMGAGVPALLEELGVSYSSLVYPAFGDLIDFWMHSLVRLFDGNANMLSEAVLLYTLSFLAARESGVSRGAAREGFDLLVDYVDGNYRDPEMSLKKLSAIFSYTEKYISHRFKEELNVGFSVYLNNLRLKYATELLHAGDVPVAEIALRCGYRDPLYFSKLFKKRTGYAPTDYIRRQQKMYADFGKSDT